MNCPSRTDPEFPDGYNQNPNALNADATTRADLGYVANARAREDCGIDCGFGAGGEMVVERPGVGERDRGVEGVRCRGGVGEKGGGGGGGGVAGGVVETDVQPKRRGGVFGGAVEVVRKYLKFVGPGFMVAVAYIDPGMLALIHLSCNSSATSEAFSADVLTS
jgi:metal iron transporter